MSRKDKAELEALRRLKTKAYQSVTAQLAQTREAVEERLQAVVDADKQEAA